MKARTEHERRKIENRRVFNGRTVAEVRCTDFIAKEYRAIIDICFSVI